MSNQAPSREQEDSKRCPVCWAVLRQPEYRAQHGVDVRAFSCPQCGDFHLTGAALASLPSLLQQHRRNHLRLSHAIRWFSREQGPPVLDAELIERLTQRPLPDLPDQLDLLVRWLGETTELGQLTKLDPMTQQAIIGAPTGVAFAFVVEHLQTTGIISGQIAKSKDGIGGSILLTVAGWERYREIVRGARQSRRAFMAMAFNKPDLDQIVEQHFRRAVQETGFELLRLDDDPQAGLIDNRLRVEIRRSRFLIADLSHDNAGAYWEAGFAEGLGKPVIYTCVAEKKTHFDARNCQTVFWDPADPGKAAADLKATIRATLPGEAAMEDP